MSSANDYEGIVVLGFPRSGTTLIRRLLNAHPNICCPPETNLLSGASRFLNEERFAGGLSVGVESGLAFSGYEPRDVVDRLRELVFKFLREISDKAGKRRWAEKTAFSVFHIDQIERICGNSCRYLCVFRHGLDVVCSTRDLCERMEIYLPELHYYVRKYPAPFEAFAHAWVDVNRRLVKFINAHPNECVQVRYEDLTRMPQTQLKQIFEFLDEPTDVDGLIKTALNQVDSIGLGDWKTYQQSRIKTTNIGRWEELDGTTVARLAPIINQTLVQIGYQQVKIPQGASGDNARHRYELTRMVAHMKAAKESPKK